MKFSLRNAILDHLRLTAHTSKTHNESFMENRDFAKNVSFNSVQRPGNLCALSNLTNAGVAFLRSTSSRHPAHQSELYLDYNA